MKSENILYEVVEGRARITLNRPEKRNALSDDLLRDLEEALWEADDDTRVHVVIIRGAGQVLRWLRLGGWKKEKRRRCPPPNRPHDR